MVAPEAESVEVTPASSVTNFSARGGFPWWLLVMGLLVCSLGLAVIFSDTYQEAFGEIIPGLGATVRLTIASFIVSMALGLLLGIGRLHPHPAANTLPTVYIEFIRGVPMIVFVFAIAFIVVPAGVDGAEHVLHAFSWVFDQIGLEGAAESLDRDLRARSVNNMWRGGIALSLFYAAFIAEVVRAGIQSVPVGQIEAGKALGLSNAQVMRRITLPQAIRNTLPALGNDLIALMKDTSLVSVIAAAELTYNARIYQGSSFRVRETFFILMAIYVTMTLLLSLMLRALEARLETPRRLTTVERRTARVVSLIVGLLIVWLFYG